MDVIKLSVIYLAIPLVLTIIMEMPVLIIGFKNEDYQVGYKLLVFVLVNAITNLTLNSLNLVFRFELYYVIIAEILIVIAEAFIYMKAFSTNFGKTLLYSFLANAFSGIIGSFLLKVLIRLLIG